MLKQCLSALGAVLLTAGCSNMAVFDYGDAPGTMVKFPGGGTKSVAVLPFFDQRGLSGDGKTVYPAGERGSFTFGLIPLVPFGFIEKDQPENGSGFVSLGYFHFDPSNDLADAAVASLKNANLFSPVVKAKSPNSADTDYLFLGTVRGTGYRGKTFTYGITYLLSPALWILGAPSGVSVNELWIDLELKDRKTRQTLWRYSTRKSDWLVHWIYARNGRDTSMYSELMKASMNEALLKLQQQVGQ